MILVWSAVMILVIHLFGDMLIHIFIDASETEVMSAARTYFRAVAWCYPFLGSIFLYRNALQGLGYGLMPMMGGVFELIARAAIVAAGEASGMWECAWRTRRPGWRPWFPLCPITFIKFPGFPGKKRTVAESRRM